VALGERGRNPLMARSTAEGAASLRAAGALEPDSAVRCPDDMAAGFLGGFNATTLAKHRLTRPIYLRRVNQILPGAYPYEIARCKFIDEVTLGEAGAGVDEVVLLGAGLDSRPYRLADRLERLRVFEVDHPASQATKRARLRRRLGDEPRGVRFVPVDFTRDELATEMARAGHDERAATLFIWSGVSPYLPEEAVTAVLSWVGAHTSPRTSIVFDAIWASVLGGESNLYGARELLRSVDSVAEPLRWGIPDGEADQTLERFGLRAERILDDEDAIAMYLTRTDGSVLGRPYGFGVLLHARVVTRAGS
jgi:methyltransferase (TIGR00027 family)